jgi:hypothetical protein
MGGVALVLPVAVPLGSLPVLLLLQMLLLMAVVGLVL